MRARRHRSHARTVVPLLAVLAAMSGVVYYSAPLYRLFCQVTGYGGSTRQARVAPGAVSARIFTIRFNADVSPNLPWKVQPVAREYRLRAGARKLARYRAHNVSNRAVTGTSSFNVTPAKAGRYFVKIACFCFTRQRLAAGQIEDMPVTFFIDPAILKDRNLADVTTITLSYTFFRASPAKAKKTAAAGRATGPIKLAIKRTYP
jgi:cytochrome c oxidase assembly protein subunit 11